MDVEVFRSVERLAVVLIGGLSVYLGYRLFLSLPDQKDSQGRITLPGDISIYLSRVGPGVFFGLFGAIIVTGSLYFSVTIYDKDTGAPIWVGVSPNLQAKSSVREQSAIDVANLKGDLTLLNKVDSYLGTDTTPEYRADLAQTLSRAKLALLKSAWQSDWGSYERFESIVLEGDSERLTPQQEMPQQLYESGSN